MPYSGRNPVKLAARALELYRRGGVGELYQGARDYLSNDYQSRRTDNEYRWKFIRRNIDDSHESFLDIGCAAGFFCAKAAEMGLDVVGIDVNEERIAKARESCPSGSFRRMDLDVNSIQDIPDSDVTLCLAVHHHWVSAYGWSKSEKMLSTVMEKSELLIYEPPGHMRIHPTLDEELPMEEYYREVLTQVDSRIRVVDETVTEHIPRLDRQDPIYAVDCSAVE